MASNPVRYPSAPAKKPEPEKEPEQIQIENRGNPHWVEALGYLPRGTYFVDYKLWKRFLSRPDFARAVKAGEIKIIG